MAVDIERDLYAEAEARLDRPLSPGERLIDLEGNDRILEEAKAALFDAIEKEKRRQIRAFLDGREPNMRITPEMTDIIVRVRLAGMDAAEAELARGEGTVRAMAVARYFVREFVPSFGPVVYEVVDGDLDIVLNTFTTHAAAERAVARLIAASLPAAAAEAIPQGRDRFVVRAAETVKGSWNGWDVFDLAADEVNPIAHFEPGFRAEAENYVGDLVNGRIIPPTPVAAAKSLTAEIAARFPGWEWDERYHIFVPHDPRIREAYRRLYGPAMVQGEEGSINARAKWLVDSGGFDPQIITDARWAHDVGWATEGPGMRTPVVRPDSLWEQKFLQRAGLPQGATHLPDAGQFIVDYDQQMQRWVVRDNLGNAVRGDMGGVSGAGLPRQWADREHAQAWLNRQVEHTAAPRQWVAYMDVRGRWVAAPDGQRIRAVPFANENAAREYARMVNEAGGVAPSPEQVREAADAWKTGPPKPIARWGPESHRGLGAGIPMPRQSEVDLIRQDLLRWGMLGPRPVNPAQMLLFDPQMQPLMDAFNMQMRGISKRITKEGLAQLTVNQDAGVQALARAIDKKVPGALDAAGRMVSGPFNQGLGDVFKRKGGLFKKWQYSAVMDKATCDVCAYFDGTIYYSWRAIAELPTSPLPNGGPNPGCFGDQRCRCRPVPYFGTGIAGAVEPTGTIPVSGGADDFNDQVNKGTLISEEPLGGGVTDTREAYIRLPDGSELHAKLQPVDGLRPIHSDLRDDMDVSHEMAAKRIADRLEGDPRHQIHVPRYASVRGELNNSFEDVSFGEIGVQEWAAKDGETAEEGGQSGRFGRSTDAEVRGVALFDTIIGNKDRHGGNYMNVGRTPWLVDNGLSFPYYNSNDDRYYGNGDGWPEWQKRFGSYRLDESDKAWLSRLYDNKDDVDAELGPYLDGEERQSMWERIHEMIRSGTLIGPDGSALGGGY